MNRLPFRGLCAAGFRVRWVGALFTALFAGFLAASAGADILFEERAVESGVDFQHHHGASGRRYIVETMSGGVVIFDFDKDGDEDLFFVDGGALPGYEGPAAMSRLYRNEGGGRFVDATGASGIRVAGYGNGGTAGDVDGDGDVDLYLTVFGPNELWLNRGDGTFELSEDLESRVPAWSASAAFGDPDADGDLDLYVVNYLEFTTARHRDCDDPTTGLPTYCQPSTYPGARDLYLINDGAGRFEEATAERGLTPIENMAGLGVLFGDFDGDGWPDLYVSNDTDPNFLFVNRGDGSFEDRSLLSGAALSDRGISEAGMGVDFGDLDGDGRPDLVVTNFEMESNALYRNVGGGFLVDHRYPSRLAEASKIPLGFGVATADFDGDGDLDLMVANGHVRDNAELFNERSHYAQPNQLFENVGDGVLREVEGAGLDVVLPSRGLAVGDLDGDGDLDAVVTNSGRRAELYVNVSPRRGSFLDLDLVSIAGAPRAGVTARLTSGGLTQLRETRTASSYQSQGASPLHFGLASQEGVDRLEITGAGARSQRWLRPPAGRRVRWIASP